MYRLFSGMKLDESGVIHIQKHEGYRDTPYKCPAGMWTVGYGTVIEYEDSKIPTIAPYPYDMLYDELRQWGIITQTAAVMALMENADNYMSMLLHDPNWTIKEKPEIEETQNQYNALASLVYNIGVENLVKARNFRAAITNYFSQPLRIGKILTECWEKFTLVKGHHSLALIARRASEIDLFFT